MAVAKEALIDELDYRLQQCQELEVADYGLMINAITDSRNTCMAVRIFKKYLAKLFIHLARYDLLRSGHIMGHIFQASIPVAEANLQVQQDLGAIGNIPNLNPIVNQVKNLFIEMNNLLINQEILENEMTVMSNRIDNNWNLVDLHVGNFIHHHDPSIPMIKKLFVKVATYKAMNIRIERSLNTKFLELRNNYIQIQNVWENINNFH